MTITCNGREAAIIISPEDLAQFDKTISVLNDPGALADVRDADAPRTPRATDQTSATPRRFVGEL